MRFAAAASLVNRVDQDLPELCRRAESQLDGRHVDLAAVFFTSHFEDEAPTLVGRLVRQYPSAVLVGCSAEGVIGADAEHERVPAVALMLASLPGVKLAPLRAETDRFANIDDVREWLQSLGAKAADRPTFFFFGDPFTVPINPVLSLFNEEFPRRPVLGGMVSGCEAPGQSVLVLDDQVYRNGAVGMVMSGPLDVRVVVSQGCRPIGERLVITKAKTNVILELGGKPALARLREILNNLPIDDARLAQESLFVGLATDEHKGEFKRGDFVIRHLLGIDPNTGAMAITDEVRVGASIQFHVRDQASADEDLREMLQVMPPAPPPAGALLFSCNGRGTRMWDAPNHDVSVFHEICGPVPVTGFFAAGELGPIGGKNFIHGHTVSIALFHPSVRES